ncbi:MAG: hypothetical protein IPL65_20385 [Lewinellaceae bacterium]|nr:hypothetical protein [Lewinellaceae bacterium]
MISAPLELKIILVGNATSGKTSLSKVLRGEPFNSKENSTHGIQISEWLLSPTELRNILPGQADMDLQETLRVNIWDFGGQEYYHGTHQIFLDNNAVYVLIWDERHNQNSTVPTELFFDNESVVVPQEHFHYRYWLDSIRHSASGQTSGMPPPVLLLQNKVDLQNGQPRFYDANLLKRYTVDHNSAIRLKYARARKAPDRRYR